MNVKKILLLGILLFSCQLIAASEFKEYKTIVNGIEFRIDSRIELFNLIAMQFGHTGMTTNNIPYKNEILERFSAWKDDDAPKLLRETWSKGWTVDDPVFFLLHLDENFNISEKLDQAIIERGGGMEQLQKLASAMEEYAEKSDFYGFFNQEQEQFYRQILQQTSYNYRNFEAVDLLEEFYGKKGNSYTVILNLLSGYGNFGRSISEAGKFHMYAVVETNSAADDLPLFKPSISGIELLLHEFSHGFINPAVDRFYDKNLESAHLYEPIKESMKYQGYQDWLSVLNEHIVRAAVIELVENGISEALANKVFYRFQMGRRFIYIDRIREELDYYQANRKKYPSFEDFVPELLRSIDKISEAEITYQQQKVEHLRTPKGIIPRPYEFATDSTTLFVVGTHEKDPVGQKVMHDFAEEYRKMISPNSLLITDEEALKMDLENYDLVLFGTANGNTILKQYIDQLPISISDAGVSTNKIIRGENLQLVTSWVNPFNEKKAMIIYTAQKAKNIRGFYYSPNKDQFHYWVGRDAVALEVGDYKRQMEIWIPDIFE